MNEQHKYCPTHRNEFQVLVCSVKIDIYGYMLHTADFV